MLLLPYKNGKEELQKISDVYKKLLEQNRLFIQKQVVKEFAKNRPDQLANIYRQI
ncbi:MAG: hypothetical protein IJH34_15315 [Romboutsia sp.]|nr:hypothetical protein [Romboutsia sp.]